MSGAAPPLVLHVIHHLVTGGMENGLVNLINGMPAEEFTHAIACIEDFSEFRDRLNRPEVEVIALRRSRVGVWRTRAALYALCRRIRPALVHTRNLSGLDALLPARLAGVGRIVHSEHGWDVDDLGGENRRHLWLRRIHAPLVTRYIAVSRHLERYLAERVGVGRSRITQIYNGVDVDRFGNLKKMSIAERPLELRGDHLFVVGTIGRVQPVKDQETLLRAFADLLRIRPGVRARARLVVVGDGPLLPQLRKLATSLGIADKVWLPGSRSDVPEILNLFDVFVLPSLNEGISNTILEAMASELPVIATRVGGNVELIEPDVTGCLFAPRDVLTLADLLASYADGPSRRVAHGLAGRRRAVEYFALPTMIEQYRSTYASVLAGRPRTRAASTTSTASVIGVQEDA